jgi:hypothetical protein
MSPHAENAFKMDMNARKGDVRPPMAHAIRGTNEIMSNGMTNIAMNLARESSPR